MRAESNSRAVCVRVFPDRAHGEPAPEAVKRSRRGAKNTIDFEVREHLHRMTGVDLTRIDGIDVQTALPLVGEIGLDMNRWPSEKHFSSWLGLCPGTEISGGKRLGSRTKPCANRAAAMLRMAAQSLANSRSALGAYYRRMRGRLGPPQAITATAHKLARLVYSMLSSRPRPRPSCADLNSVTAWETRPSGSEGGEAGRTGLAYHQRRFREASLNPEREL